MRCQIKVIGLLAVGMSMSSQAHADKAQEYGCSVSVEDLSRDMKEEQTHIIMKSDSRLRTYTLNTIKVIAKLDLRDLDRTTDRQVNSYWANHRAITLSIVDMKDRVQAQLNNTVNAMSGPFEYQTRTTQYAIKLHCDPVGRIVSSK